MIERFRVSGFKRFADNTFDFAPLVVLAGLNGTGKTSLIQALLLCRAAALCRQSTLPLNGGPFELELGTAGEIHNRKSDGDMIFSFNDEAYWRFAIPAGAPEALYVEITERGVDDRTPFHIIFGPAPRGFTYLSAERLGPRSVLHASSLSDEELEIGIHGEFSAQVLATLGDRPMAQEDRLHPNGGADAVPFLKYELEAWLSEIVRPIQIDAVTYAGGLLTALHFGTPGGEFVAAPNMGFGVSYALPVVLAGLISKPGSLLLVENPEAHLHPAGQSRMGVFLAWLAGRGVQVVVETHSDHVLNGMRRAIGELGFLTHNDAIIHFFEADVEDALKTSGLRFTRTGWVSDWPPGFFDQYQVDIAALGRVRRRV